MSSKQDSVMGSGQGAVIGHVGIGVLHIHSYQNPKQEHKWSEASFVRPELTEIIRGLYLAFQS